jgi:hypothetical protein
MESFKCVCGKKIGDINDRCSKCNRKYVICERCSEPVCIDDIFKDPGLGNLCQSCHTDEQDSIYN